MTEYSGLVGKVRGGIAQLQSADSDPRALRVVDAAMKQIGAMCERVAMYKPRAIRHLMVHNCDSHQPADLDPDHWRAVVAGVFLSQQQEYELLAARGRFMSGLQSLLAKRQRIEELLASSRQPKRSTHVDVLSASLSALDAYEDLKANVVAEHQLHMEFVIFMFKNRQQAVACVVMLCPELPDGLVRPDAFPLRLASKALVASLQ
eukprot:gene8127-8321_t